MLALMAPWRILCTGWLLDVVGLVWVFIVRWLVWKFPLHGERVAAGAGIGVGEASAPTQGTPTGRDGRPGRDDVIHKEEG